MEFGEQLTAPALHVATGASSSSSAAAKAASSECASQEPGVAGGSSLTSCGHLLQMMGDERLKMSRGAAGFPALGRPGFELHSLTSNHPECGSFGGFGFPSLAAHSQFGAFPDWWQESEKHGRGTAAFFPPLLNLHPAFASNLKSYDPSHLQSSGVGGMTTGSSASPTGSSAVKTKPLGTMGTSDANSRHSPPSVQDVCQQRQRDLRKTQAKKPSKRQAETCSSSSSQSGSSFDGSSDGEDSDSGTDDTEDEGGNEEDEADQSNDTEDSEKNCGQKETFKRLTRKTSEGKNKTPVTAGAGGTPSALRPRRPPPPSPPAASDQDQQQHISVIHATGSAAGTSPPSAAAGTSRRETAAASRPSPSSPRSLPPRSNSICSSPKPLAVSLSPSSAPFSTSPLTEPSTLFASPRPPRHKVTTSTPPNHKERVDGVSGGRRLLLSSFVMQPIHPCNSAKQAFTGPPPRQNCSDTKLFLVHHPNGAVPTAAQDAPLALTTTTRSQSSSSSSSSGSSSSSSGSGSGSLAAAAAVTSPSYPPTAHRTAPPGKTSGGFASLLRSSASLDVTLATRKRPAPARPGKSPAKSSLAGLLGASAPGGESDVHRWRDSDESSGEEHDDDDDDDLEEEDSGSSLSDSDSNAESDSDGSENEAKDQEGMEVDSDAERTRWNLNEASPSTYRSPSNLPCGGSSSFQPHANPQSSPASLRGTAGVSGPVAVSKGRAALPSVSSTAAGSGKRRRVTDETILHLPLEFGWRRETRIRAIAGRLQGEVAYFAPCGKKLRQYPDVMKYLLRNGITEISRDNFSYSTKIKVGDFYEAREGPEGLQWVLLAEEEIAPAIVAMDGRRSRCAKPEHQGAAVADGHSVQDVNNAKLLRKLEAQEIARQAAQLKLMRKLEKQAMLQAAKEARRQQAIMAAEEKRKKREQMKLEKQQEKIKRIQQIRMERELRAQQILEERKRKKEEAASAKLLENEKRNKEREMRRLQAVILKKQDLERHRLDMERERRKQHMMLMKAMEARKRAEEKERLRREKNNERHLSKMRRLELRRQELELAKQLKKPNEDMCLADHKPLPEIPRVPGVILPPATFSDCLMVLQFLHSFGKMLRLDVDAHMLNPRDLQEGLLNMGENAGRLQDMLVRMLSVAVSDPGMPAGHKSKTLLGDNMTSVHIDRDNVSEILHIYMSAQCEQTHLAPLALSLRTKAFRAHSPSQKASMLAFLVNELCCSKAVISEIDKNIEHMTNLRKDKMVVDKELRTLRSIHAKKTGKKDSSSRREDGFSSAAPAARSKGKRKEADSDEDEDEEDDSEDPRDDDDEEEEEPAAKREKKADACEEEDNSAQSATVEELEKLIEKTHKQQSQIKQKLFDSSQLLRSMAIGQDRYRRHYWVLPRCGGIFVEGMESCEGSEEVERERKRQVTAQVVKAEETQWGEPETTGISDVQRAVPESHESGNALNLFLQKPSAASPKLSHLSGVAATAADPKKPSNNQCSPNALAATSHPADGTGQGVMENAGAPASSPPGRGPWMTCSPQSFLQEEHFAKAVTEKSGQWFSLLPRSPCDDSSVTSGSSPANSASSPVPLLSASSSSSFPYGQFGAATPPGVKSTHAPTSQQVKCDSDQSGLALCDRPVAAASPALHSASASPAPELDVASQQAEGNPGGDLSLASAASKSDTQEPPDDKPSCASAPTAEVARVQDYPSPQPIPPEMLCGWWRTSKVEEMQSLIKAFHSRGIRERVLQKQIQKHLEYIDQVSQDSMHVREQEVKEWETSMETMECWCTEEQAMEVDIDMLQQVEALERKVVSAGLQVKGWMHAAPQSKRPDLVYHEQKLLPSASPDGARRDESQKEAARSVARRPNNPLDIAVGRLAELQRNIEQREEEGAAGVKLWHKALAEVRSSAQLSLCIGQLQKSINWERSISKLRCHFCEKGDKEELLLLCDGCDQGYHTYCHKPKMSTVPDGEWFCANCICKRSAESQRLGRQQSKAAAAGVKKGSELKRNNSKPPAPGEVGGKQGAANGKRTAKKGAKELRAQKGDKSAVVPQGGHDSQVCGASRAKVEKESATNGLTVCRVLLDELEAHRDAWPFLTPVNHKAVPGYKKIIKKPMDFSTIREKLTNNQYHTLDSFVVDVNLVFENCEKFNEDDSEIGQAGHSMKNFFNKRRATLLH